MAHLVASGETVVDGGGERVRHVARVLRCGADRLAVPVSVGRDTRVVLVRHLVLSPPSGRDPRGRTGDDLRRARKWDRRVGRLR